MEKPFSNESPESSSRSRFEGLWSLKRRKPTAFGAATVLVVFSVLSCIAGLVVWLMLTGLIVILSGRFGFTNDEVIKSILCCIGPFVAIGVVLLLIGMLILGVSRDERRT